MCKTVLFRRSAAVVEVPLTAGLTYFVGAKMSGAEEQPAPVVGSPPTITTVEEPVIEEVREDEGAAIGAQADAVEAEGAEAEGAEAESAEAEGTEAEGADGAELAEGEGAGAEEGAERAAAEAESDDEARRRAERRRARALETTKHRWRDLGRKRRRDRRGGPSRPRPARRNRRR